MEGNAERLAHQDRKLLRCVVSVEVRGGIGFGIAELLRLLQSVLELPSFAEAAQQIIAGAVHDTVESHDRAFQPAQGLDDRRAAADSGRKAQLAAAAQR